MDVVEEKEINKITTGSSEPVRRLPLYTFYIANTISMVGSYMTYVAVPWFVLQTTGSVTQMAIAAFCTTTPAIISAFFASALVDRAGYKLVSVVSDGTSAVTTLLVPLLYLMGWLPFWMLLVLVFVGGLLKMPGQTARSALLPDLVEQARIPMERATAASDGVSRLSGFLGLPLAAALVASIGASNVLWIDAATFIISALLIGLLVPASFKKEEPVKSIPSQGAKGYLTDLGDGLRFIRKDKLVLFVLITVLITNLLDAGLSTVIAPAYFKQHFQSPLPMGIVFGVMGGCGFLGTVLFGAFGHHLSRRWSFVTGFNIAGGTRFLALAFFPFLPILIAVNIVAGFFLGPINPVLSTTLYERVPVEMRARIFGMLSAGVMVGIPLGELSCGYLIEWFGLQSTLLVTGSIYMLATLSLLVNPVLKDMEKKAIRE